MTQRKTIYKNIAISGSYTYANQAISFIAMIFLARLLSPADYGTIALILVFSAFINIFQDNGILQAVIRGNKDDSEYLGKLNALSLIAGTIGTLFMWLLAIPISIFYSNTSLLLPTIVLGFSFLLNSFIIVPCAALQKEFAFKTIGKIQTVSNVIAICICGIAAYYGFSYWSLVIRELIYLLLQVIFLSAVKKVRINFDVKEIRTTFLHVRNLAASMIGFGIINYFSRNADKLLIGKVYAEEKLGIYNRAYSLILLSINLVSGVFNQVLLPSLEKQSISKIKEEYYFSTSLIVAILFPVVIIFNIIPEKITLLLWGRNWVEVIPLLPYVGILIFSQCQINISGNFFILCNKENYLVRVAIINTVITTSAVIGGSMISFVDVIRYYTLSFIFLSVPLTVYVISCVILKDTLWSAIKFWFPKILILWTVYLLTLAQEQKNYLLWVILCIVFYLHIIIINRKDIVSLLTHLTKK